ncbi:hypothetical protein HMPREF0530_2771 [Lacticaseibacillus paracasei subsp. paracasei ATCC 25302 = DSM 5622 = JCM 8130]|nr:hypothetical protein HMPREF0530_2771 [Lacticaseibacillus paracasei subsp. paracasei ATCC 25302 = DSM 5622 = JCM 8130]
MLKKIGTWRTDCPTSAEHIFFLNEIKIFLLVTAGPNQLYPGR